jgi:hypothetical protein
MKLRIPFHYFPLVNVIVRIYRCLKELLLRVVVNWDGDIKGESKLAFFVAL